MKRHTILLLLVTFAYIELCHGVDIINDTNKNNEIESGIEPKDTNYKHFYFWEYCDHVPKTTQNIYNRLKC